MAKCLSFHASYRCRRTGVCCSANWKIPFDLAELDVVAALPITSGAVDHTANGGSAVMSRGRCTFLETDAAESHACEIHRLGGHQALPLTCRMFPRVVLH